MLRVGSTLLIPTPPLYNVKHLSIIIAIKGTSQKALIVNITSKRLGCDDTCMLIAGEHRFLTHPSVIDYSHAKIAKISALDKSIKNGIATPDDPVSKELLKKIQQGAMISPAIPLKCLNFLSSNM